MGSPASTIRSLLTISAERCSDRPAILAPGRRLLDYGGLSALATRTVRQLRQAGFTRRARIAIVLPNGPAMATAFAAVASGCASAPLNPGYTRADFEFYLTDLKADALLVEQGASHAAVEAAEACDVAVLQAAARERAGDFDLILPAGLSAASPMETPDWLDPDDVALLLHTSGTTSRPKLVPLSAANLAASASHVATTLALQPVDRCLNIMPLFHIHGLVAAVLASLHAGASIVCTDGVYGAGFFEWLRDFHPTWYTAVPTMHQAIAAKAAAHRDVIAEAPLRFVRSSSASLPPSVLTSLEEAFHAPVVEAYGMTEAAHQMASNPLPPLARKPGTVGRAAGPDLAIMGTDGRLLGAGETGEVVIRGPNVTSGYADDPTANAEAFSQGWFRTGDQGVLDADGYLRLTGRLKELINRGGEKISPREVDEVLLGHPAVGQALTFAVPHVQLGEEVGAAVELRLGAKVSAAELRAWAGDRLAPFKVPRVLRFVDALPKGPTGKLQRIGLAARLEIEPLDDRRVTAPHVPPRSDLEHRLAAIWRDTFPGVEIGVRTRFETLGGDSLLAARMLSEVSDAIGMDVPYLVFAEDGTIEALAQALQAAQAERSSPLVPVRRGGVRPPLFCVPGHDGALHGIDRLARALPDGQPVWAFDLRRMELAGSVEALAAACLDLLIAREPRGPYHLAGVCFGGLVAAEVARQAVVAGRTVASVTLIDSLNPAWRRLASPPAISAARLAQLRAKSRHHAGELRGMPVAGAVKYVAGRGAAFVGRSRERLGARVGSRAITSHNLRIADRYEPQRLDVDALVIRVVGRRLHAPDLGWRGVISGDLTTVDVPFDVDGALSEAGVRAVAAPVAERLSGRMVSSAGSRGAAR